MANKTLKIDLQFNANIKEAQRQMQQLQQSLSQLATSQPMTNFSLTPQLKEAKQSAMDLKIALNNAMNVDTGRLNLNKFQSELNRSGKSIQQYAQQLQALGPSGVRAFQQVAQAVAQADTKMFNLSGGAKKLMDTLGNTVRWQLTSSAIHGVMSAFSDTISYAKELDTSLNNIRIVTGKSADQMARFAKEANSMAKQLSTTTTKNTDASLIYYQQGLNDKEVKERTDTTVKLANVTGETAEQVSEWMTSIWNNFDDGTMALERYADMIAKLGAATASSADEIATGLEKFAAVADTVGLSYEYATSALATVTAETRQSADVVGTAFKTLFARIEGLKFGETLEDGTDLNQYSLALQTVGVNIKDANGELKDMDTILDQTGARWQTLNKDQQIALAQQVAGIRQYNQFMALMENWDVMQNNLKLVEQSNGALEEQNRIYEESMVASKERMKAAGEELKALIVGGDDLVPLYNFAGGALEVITELLEAFGGLPTIILGVATALTKLYQPQIASFFSQAAVGLGNLKSASLNFIHRKGFKADNTYQINTARMAANMAAQDTSTTESMFMKQNADLALTQAENENKLSASAKQIVEWKKQELQVTQELLLKTEEQIEQSQQLLLSEEERIKKATKLPNLGAIQSTAEKVGAIEGRGAMVGTMLSQAQNAGNLTQQSRTDLGNSITSQLTAMEKQILNLDMAINDDAFEDIRVSLENFIQTGTKLDDVIAKVQKLNEQISKSGTDLIDGSIDEAVLSQTNQSYNALAQATNIKDTTSINTTMTTLNAIKTEELPGMSNKFKSDVSQLKSDGKAIQEYNRVLKDKAKWLKENTTATQTQIQKEKAYKDAVSENNNKIKDFNKKVASTIKGHKNSAKAMKNNIRNTKEYQENIETATKETENFKNTSRKTAASTEQFKEGVKNAGEQAKDLEENLKNGGKGFTHWSDNLAAGISNMATYAMGLSMLSSAFEQMGSSIAKGEGGWTNWISNISSLLMGIMMIMPALSNMNKLILQSANAIKTKTLTEYAEIAATKIKSMFHKKTMVEEKEEQKEKQKTSLWKIMSAWAGVAEDAGEGPTGWVKAITSAAMIAPIALAVGAAMFSFSSGSKQAKKEEKQEEVSKGAESLEAINENQELAESVTDLTEEYNALRNASESTADILEDMREKIPELIESYKELAKTMGTHIDTSELEKAYEVFLATGDTSLLEKAQEKLNTEVQKNKKSIAETTVQNATELMIDSARKGRGRLDGDIYHIDLGEPNDEVNKELKKIFGEFWGGDNVRIDSTNSAEVLNYYEKAIKARDRLKELGYEDTDAYKRLADDVKEMAENAENAYAAQESKYEALKKELLELDTEGLDKISGTIDGTTISGDQIKDLQTYELYRDELIKSLVKEYEMTEANAQAYLEATDALGHFEEAHEFFKKGGLGFNKDANEQTIKDIKEWFANLPEEERTLAMTIDYTTVATKEDAAAALEEARKKAEEAGILQEVEKLEIDEGTFDTYTEGLADLNKELDENENLTKQIALNNLKISKGLTTLTKSWDDNFEIIKRGNKASLEYAEAIGEVKTAFEEMFGVKPSTEYIEQYSNEINEMANGNLDSLQKLQDALAEDYIMNMDFSTAINEDWSGTIKDAQSQLRGLIDSIDTSIEIGKESTLSQDYLNQVQNMLDAGVIAEEQLEKLFRAKGFELNITGWKSIPGPIKKTTQKTYDGNTGKEESYKVIEEQEDIKVPIINGDTSGLKSSQISGAASMATVTKSTDKRVIDTSAAEEKADKAKDRRKKLEDELDRYHEINEIISDTERELDKLGKAKDRAFGASKIALMDKEIAKQKELIENNKKLLEEAKKYYQQDRSKLLSSWDVQLDSTGRISNYEEIQQRYINRLNANTGNEKLYEDIEEEYEAFKDAAEKYEESLNKVEEQAEKVNDELDALYEKNLEKIEYKVQIKVDIADDDKAYLDFLMQKVEDDAFAAAEAIGYLGEEAQLTLDKIKANEGGIAEVERALAAGDITPEQAVEKMREYRDELVDLNADLLEIRQTVQDKLTEAFESWNEEIERGITKLEHYGSVLENYKNIIDIVGKDMLGISDETMSNLSKAQIANANNIIRATKAQLDANNSTLEKMRQARAEAEARRDEESVKEWDEQIKIAEEKSQELTTTLQEALSNGLQLAADDFALTVDQIADSFSKAVSGIYNDIEDMRDGWDRMQEVADRYLETYEQTYEISKLNRKIQDSIDKTDSIASQKELRDLQDEMYKMTKDGQQLSKYDLEYLQKKYDLLVAEQAFKDAQNAKSVVRLQRDSEGNFGYVYTADQGTVDNAEQNYEDKLYAFQEYTHKMDEELAEMYISVQEQAYERMQAAAEMYGEGTEAFERERQKILEQYNIDMGYITDEYEKLTNRNLEINEIFNAGVADTYEKTFINSIVPQYQSFEQLYDETTTQCEASCIRLDEAITLLQQIFDKQLELAGQDLEGFEETANKELEKVQEDSSITANKVEDMSGRMDAALNGSGGAIDAVEGFQIAYSGQMEAIRNATDLTIQKVNNLIQEYAALAKAANIDYIPSSNSGSGTYNNTTGKTSGPNSNTGSKESANDTDLSLKTTNENKAAEKFNTISASTGGHYTVVRGANGKEIMSYNFWENKAFTIDGYKKDLVDVDGTKMRLYRISYPKAFYSGSAQDGVGYINQKDLNQMLGNSIDYQIWKDGYNGKKLKSLDTGGYTGAWGPEGRLAMLHQKEIVLNAHDTENFLAAIGIVRDISDQIEKNAIVMQYQSQLANYRASIGNSGETLQQEVHITAEFPNATDHNEIEEAFKNLTNLASQYANRK